MCRIGKSQVFVSHKFMIMIRAAKSNIYNYRFLAKRNKISRATLFVHIFSFIQSTTLGAAFFSGFNSHYSLQTRIFSYSALTISTNTMPVTTRRTKMSPSTTSFAMVTPDDSVNQSDDSSELYNDDPNLTVSSRRKLNPPPTSDSKSKTAPKTKDNNKNKMVSQELLPDTISSKEITKIKVATPIKRKTASDRKVKAIPKTKGGSKIKIDSQELLPNIISPNEIKDINIVSPIKRNKKMSKPSKPTTRKVKPSIRKKRRIRIEPGSLEPPEDYNKVYRLVEELRSDRTAPIDVDGCSELGQRDRGDVVFRFQTLIALMLSSQTKDAVVGEAIRLLQREGPLDVRSIDDMEHDKLNTIIGKVGFHNNKTKYIKQTVRILLEQYDGDIPPTVQEMIKLPGVGPKMAYIVECVAWNVTSGIGVDTHMHRLFNNLKWVNSKNPEDTREQMEGWLPKERWGNVNLLWVGVGQEVQQQKEKVLKKCIASSDPKESLKLVDRLGLNIKKEGKRYQLEQEIRAAMGED